MLGHRELTIQDYTEMLQRRFWLIFTCTVMLFVVGVGLTFVLTPRYVSKTTVLIEQQQVPEDYVKPVVNEDMNSRLATMKEQVLSRSRIEPIIERFNLFPGSKYTMDDRVDLTQKAIHTEWMRAEQSHGIPGFYISFTARDARTAQLVCGEITSLFMSANLNAREESAEGTTDFLKQQLEDSKRSLDEQDAKLAAFQRKYIGKLPEQESSNTNTLQALTTQLSAITQTVSRTQQDVTFIETLIAQQSQESSHVDPGTGLPVDTPDDQLKKMIADKEQLEALYTPNHPDVIAITRKINNLQAKIARNSTGTAKDISSGNRQESSQLQQLKTQLRLAQQAASAAKQEQARIEQQVRKYEELIESSPMIEQEYKQVTRDHDTALQFYNALLSKMNESSMATALEHRQQGEQFRVLDAPNLPEEPTFPKRSIFAGGGLAGGLFLGILLAALLEYRDTSLRNERDVWAFTKLPTLATISLLNNMPEPGPNEKRRKLVSRQPIAKQKTDIHQFAGLLGADPVELRSPEITCMELDTFAQLPWNLSLTSLPTLGGSGECIEQFRALRSHIYQLRDQAPLKTILVSSGMPAEGKSFVATNLAMSLAGNRNNGILLVDADLRGPTIHTILGAPNKPGLTEYLAGTATAEDILQRNENLTIDEAGRERAVSNFAFISAGDGGDNASELIANRRMEDLITTLSPHFDWIIIDSPPVLAFSDAIDLARVAGGVLLVARGASTPFNVAQKAQAAFSNSRVLGFVLNAVKDVPNNSSYYYAGV